MGMDKTRPSRQAQRRRAQQEEKKEQHNPHFKGWFIPADIVRLFRNRELNVKEMVLLATIDSLVNTETGVGCYATNKYLAEELQIKDTKVVQEMISKFRSMGLVNQLDYDGTCRYLETAWSRVRPVRANLKVRG